MDDPLALSMIEHYAYCPRQAALIHIEAQWQSNADTAHGEVQHAAIDRAVRRETREGIVTWLSLPVWSEKLNVHGICDAVELRDQGPVPVEHKPRLPKRLRSPAAQQLALQAMCLEEMYDCAIGLAYVFTRSDNRRHEIQVDTRLRDSVIENLHRCRAILRDQELPPPVADARCRGCSLRDSCGVLLRADRAGSLFEPRDLEDW